MIIVQLKGGLGNQLFQYAAGLSLARHHHVSLKVDVRLLAKPDEQIGTSRNYELQHLSIPPDIADSDEVASLTHHNIFTRYFQKLLPPHKRKIYNEKRFEFDENFFTSSRSLYLKGYRQSEKYFLPIEGEIRNDFRFGKTIIQDVLEFGQSLRNTNSVSVHIRRGDYNNPAVQKYHGVLTQEYYQQAINKLAGLVTKPSFFIFSDSIDWVKDNLQFSSSVEFISGDISKNHYHDFYLMSQCRHNIIANSSFSWWAAWLNNNPGKVVIAPEKWFNNARLNYKDVIPGSWIRI